MNRDFDFNWIRPCSRGALFELMKAELYVKNFPNKDCSGIKGDYGAFVRPNIYTYSYVSAID